MPEEKDKKINFKILTAEHLIGEKPAETKKIEPPPKEEIKPAVIEKIEVQEEEKKENIPSRPVKEEKIIIESKPLTGLYYPEKTIPSAPEIPPAPEMPLTPEVPPMVPPPPPVTQETKLQKLPPKPELIEEEPTIPFFTPKKIFERKFPSAQPFPKKKLPFLNYALLGGGILLIVFLIIFLKPYEKFKAFLIKKETPQEEEKVSEAPSQTTVIVLPQITPPDLATSPPATLEATTPPKEKSIIPKPQIEEKLPQSTFIFPTKELPFVNSFDSKEIKMKELSFAEFERQIKDLLAYQETSGSLYNLNFTFNNQKIPFDFVFDYFLKPSKITSQEISNFKNEFTGNFAFMLYYTHTRKYPILIFEIKNPNNVRLFNKNWEKMNMSNDLKTLFLGLKPGKPLRDYFVTKENYGLTYRVFYFDNNYKVIWAITNNFLIYTATENGLKKIALQIK